MRSVVGHSRPLAARHPLRCWQRQTLPDAIRRDALLQLAAIASERAVATAGPVVKNPDVFGPAYRIGSDLTPARWRSVAAGIAVGDGLALLTISRSLLGACRTGLDPAVDAGLSALRLAAYYGHRAERLVAASELLLALPQLLREPVMSMTRRGRVVAVEQVAYRALLGASRRDGSAADRVAELVVAWVRVTADAHRRGYPGPTINLVELSKSQAALIAALKGERQDPGAGDGGSEDAGSEDGESEDAGNKDSGKKEARLSRMLASWSMAGRGKMSAVFPEDEVSGAASGPDLDEAERPTLVPCPTYDAAWASDSRKVLAMRYDGLGRAMPLVLAPDRAAADDALGTLAEEMPNFADAVARVADHLRLARRLSACPVLRLPTLVLVGPPGIGKTRFVRRLAAALGVPFAWKGLAGSSDNRDLAGTSRGWSSAQPSWAVTQLAQLGVANPVLLIDEIDKAGGGDRNGRAHDTMLTLLEPGTSRRFNDECVGGPIDLSAISWILTANDISGLPAPLRSRVAVVECGPPSPHQVAALIAGLLQDVADEHGVADPRMLPVIPRELLQELEADYARHTDPRRLRRGLVRALGMAAALEEAPGVGPVLH